MVGDTLPSNSTARKRKASELNDGFGMNGHEPSRKNKQGSKKSGSKTSDAISSPSYAVTVLGRTKPLKDGQKASPARYSIRIAKDFEMDYTVKPASWRDIRQYKNLKLQEVTFSIGSIVYINSREDIPEPPPENASDAEILRYDRKNLWVARILDIRALSHNAVYMLIAWLYWADELPMGRQSYHGDEEFILSNDLAIIDATTISSAADASFWDEYDDEMVASRPERFWRQCYDVGAWKKNKKAGLSAVRKHCKCQKPQHPDHNMWHCGQENCETWNHEQCLIDDITEKAWKDRKAGKLAEPGKHHQDKSLVTRFLDPVRATMGKYFEEKVEPSNEDGDTNVNDEITVQPHVPSSPSKRSPVKSPSEPKSTSMKPWEDIIEVTLEYQENQPLQAKIRDLENGREWITRVSCLSCGNAME